MIEIQDAAGRVIKTISLKSKKDQMILITKEWKSGVYIAILRINGKLMDTGKFSIVN
jgi:hypothetical protein